MLSLQISTTRNSYSLPAIFLVRLAARQGPALGVTPVLMPSHPCHSILFVFSHFSHPFSIPFSVSWQQAQLYALVATTSLNRVFFMQCIANLATSSAVERLLGLESPCGLAQFVRDMPNLRAVAFISCRKWPTPFSSAAISLPRVSLLYIDCRSSSPSLIIRRMTPPICAIKCAASLPLGSIIPKNKSSRLSSIPTFSSAVVPFSAVASLVTPTLTLGDVMPVASHNCSMVIRFMIFVSDAISLRLKLCLPVRKRCSRISQRTQLCALMLGMLILIFLLQCGDCRPFYTDPLDQRERLESLEMSRRSLSCLAETGLLMRQFLRTGTSPLSSCSQVISRSDSLTRSMELYLWGIMSLFDTSQISGLLLAGGAFCLRLGSGGIFRI